eukprot:COSAG01_NODE_4977_length_4575_cov_6.431635_3_plen_281_part_00
MRRRRTGWRVLRVSPLTLPPWSAQGCRRFYVGVGGDGDPGGAAAATSGAAGCVLEFGTHGWRCVVDPSQTTWLAYSMAGLSGSSSSQQLWMSLGSASANVSRQQGSLGDGADDDAAAAAAAFADSCRGGPVPCVQLTVVDGMTASVAEADANQNGRLEAGELGAMLLGVPLLRYPNATRAAGTTDGGAEALASEVEALLEQHDVGGGGGGGGGAAAGAGDGAIDLAEMPALWRARSTLEEAAMLGKHPLAFGDVWLAYAFTVLMATVGLLLGGWGEPEKV